MEQFQNLKDQNVRPNRKSKKEGDSSGSEISEEEENVEEEQNTDEINLDSNENQDNPEEIMEDSLLKFPPIMPEDFKKKMDSRKQRILSEYPKNYLNIECEKYELIIENTHVREVFLEAFGDKPYKEFPSFNHFYQQTRILDNNIEISQWKPEPPSIFKDICSNNYDEFLDFPDSSNKTSQFIHPVREKVGPKTCQVNSDEQVFWLTHEEVLIQREFKVSKVPMADCFTQQNFYHLQQTGPTTVKLTFGFNINFVKSSMFKSLIRNSSSSENRDTWNNKFKPAMIEFIKEVSQTRSSQSQQNKLKKDGRNKKPIKLSRTDRVISMNQMSIENLTAINNEINNLGGSIGQYNQKQQSLISQQKIFFYLLIAIVAANFFKIFK